MTGGIIMRHVEVLPHNEKWKQDFRKESHQIKAILQDEIHEIHHIGSTAIPHIHAKPVIDILVEVHDISKVDFYNAEMESLGYLVLGENGIKGRRYFSKGGDNRTHHVHMFEKGNPEITRHLAFRDYMITHPDEAQKYSELKQKLAEQFPTDIESYIAGKDAFIKEIDKKASIWKKENPST
jgi:GrpB-like predicted nucleotidyltransferase (UPF0157 family)